jgi:hypothetical protein
MLDLRIQLGVLGRVCFRSCLFVTLFESRELDHDLGVNRWVVANGNGEGVPTECENKYPPPSLRRPYVNGGVEPGSAWLVEVIEPVVVSRLQGGSGGGCGKPKVEKSVCPLAVETRRDDPFAVGVSELKRGGSRE